MTYNTYEDRKLMNRLANCDNPFQKKDKRVLCVCSAGLLRSPTAARVLQEKFGYNTRAAGINKDFALIPVDEVLVAWADEILCMDDNQSDIVLYIVEKLYTDGFISKKPLVLNLDIPDRFSYMDDGLVEAILKAYQGE